MTDKQSQKAGEECREAFEDYFSEGGKYQKAVERLPDGQSYKYMNAHSAWGHWQAAWNRRTEPSPAEVGSEYGSTDLGYDFIGVPVTDGDKRLMKLITDALGNDHPAFHDLMALVMDARALNQRLAVKEGEFAPHGWLCWPDGLEMRPDTAQFYQYEPMAYPRRQQAFIAQNTAQPAHPVSDDQQAKDAARYRWLRDDCLDADVRAGLAWMSQEYLTLDTAIDAALSATKQEEV